MNYYIADGQFYSTDELYHHGIKGMKWGVRRYQNKDGTLTNAGKKKYDNSTAVYETKEKTSSSTAKKVAVGAVATAGVLATAYASYTLSKAYKRGRAKVVSSAARMAKGMATNGKSAQEMLGLPAYQPEKYEQYFKEYKSSGMKKLRQTPISKLVSPELNKQSRLIKDVSTTIRKTVAPNMFGTTGPESIQEILKRYNS